MQGREWDVIFRGARRAAVVALLILSASDAGALSTDARRMGMGGVSVPHAQSLHGANPAYRAVAEREGDLNYFLIPIPIGLLATVSSPPSFDPDSTDFDPVEIFNLLANPPWHLELKDPPPIDGDIAISLGADHLRIYWDEASQVIQQEPFVFDYRLDQWSLGLGFRPNGRDVMRVQVNPYADIRGWSRLDDAFYGVLAEGDSLKPNSLYTADAYAKSAVGMAVKFAWARRLNEGGNTDVFFGIAPKLLMGFGMARSTFLFRAETGDTYFASDSLIVEERNYFRRTEGFSPGYGFGLDMGVAARRGPWDFGLGARDLAASIMFPKTTLEEQRLLKVEGETDSESITETLETGAAHRYHIKPLWALFTAYSSAHWFVVGEIKLQQEKNSFHLGGEYRLGTVALRGGILRDVRDKWQLATGVGLRLGRMELSLAMETHNRWIQEERGVALGSSLLIY